MSDKDHDPDDKIVTVHEYRSKRSLVIWNSQLNMGLLSKVKGTYIQQFGITHDKSVYLLPEEVLFLLEIDAITVDFNHIIVDFSILEQTFIPSLICKEYYMAYRYLRVNSYRVFRSSKWMQIPCQPIECISFDQFIYNNYDESKDKTDVDGLLNDICVYNVYNPNRAYKRTNPGVPDYKCIITNVDLPAISPSILSLLQQYHEHTKDRYVTVLLIVVDNDGSVLLYKLHDTKQLSVEEFK